MEFPNSRKLSLSDLNALDQDILAQLCRQHAIERLACYRLSEAGATLAADTASNDGGSIPVHFSEFDTHNHTAKSKFTLTPGWQPVSKGLLKDHTELRGWKVYFPVQDLWSAQVLFLVKRDGRRSGKDGSLDGFLEALARRLHHWFATDELRHFIDDATSQEHTHAFGSMLSQILSHEMRNPLTNVMSLCHEHELLKQSSDPAEALFASEVGRYIRQIWDIVQKIELLTDVDSSTFHNHEKPQPLDIQQLIRTTVNAESAHQKGSQAKIILVQTQAPIIIHGVSSLLYLAVRELIKNAFEFGKGTPIKVSAFQSGPSFILDVEDDGQPIPPGQEELIFLRYFQGTRSSKQQNQMRRGLGLGLFLARFVSSLHAGQLLFVRGAPGRKGTFRLILPVHDQKTENQAS